MDDQAKAGEWIGKHLFAFPANHFDLADSEHGMTLRDYFAAEALPIAWRAYDQGYTGQPEYYVEQSIARHAYMIADEMLKAREA